MSGGSDIAEFALGYSSIAPETFGQSLPCQAAGVSFSDAEIIELFESEGGRSVMMNINWRIAYIYIERVRGF